MMNKLLVAAALVSSAGVADARRIPLPAPELVPVAARFPSSPGALIEIRHGSTDSASGDSLRVMPNGRVIAVKIDEHGQVVARDIDQLGRRQIRTLRAALRSATWNVTESRIRCFAYSPAFTDYVVHGDVAFRAQLCSGKSTDEATQQAIATIESIIAAAR